MTHDQKREPWREIQNHYQELELSEQPEVFRMDDVAFDAEEAGMQAENPVPGGHHESEPDQQHAVIDDQTPAEQRFEMGKVQAGGSRAVQVRVYHRARFSSRVLPQGLMEKARARRAHSFVWHSLGDSNPCYRRERAAS